MSVQTVTIWDWPTSQEVTTAMQEGVSSSLGQQQVAEATIVDGPELAQKTITRFWPDLSTATQWHSFVISYNPVSSTIVQ